jgi:outer membrane protein OmpA-like peptidoglycan-associated protein
MSGLARRAMRVAAALLVLAGPVLAGPVLAAPAAASTARPARPSAASRELDRVEALLRLRLAGLPDGSGVLILRDDEHLTLRIPTRLLFVADSPALKADAVAAPPLAAAIQVLKKHRALQAQIVVYTDRIGGVAANQTLADQRAQGIYDALTGAGIAPRRLQQQGAGAATMVAGNDTPEGRVQNRRVEIEFARAAPATRRPAAAPPGGEIRSGPATAP